MTAVLLAIHRSDIYMPGPPTRDAQWNARSERYCRITGTANLIAAPFQAIAICGLLVGIQRLLIRNRDFPCQAGHWILVCLGAYFAAYESLRMVWFRVVLPLYADASMSDAAFNRLMLIDACLETTRFVVAAITLTITCVRFHGLLRWRLVFIVATGAAIQFAVIEVREGMGLQFFSLTEWLELMARGTLAVAAAILALVSLIDLVSRSRHDLLHYLGILVAAVFVMHGFAESVALRLIFQ